MSTEIKGRPVLRPAGNVALRHESKDKHESKDNSRANARKPTKKAPLSPSLKPTPGALVKISPLSSQPSTLRNPLIKGSLPKASSASKLPAVLSPKNLSSSAVAVRVQPPLLHHDVSLNSLHTQVRSAIADNHSDHCGALHDSASLNEVGLPVDETVNVVLALDEVNVGANPNLLEKSALSTEALSDHASPGNAQATAALLSSELIYDLDIVDDELISEPYSPVQPLVYSASCEIGIVESTSTLSELSRREVLSGYRGVKAPTTQGKAKCRFTRSSSDNFRRGSAADRTVSCSRNLNSSASHSLDDASLAHLVAAKKAAALALNAQRKLKVAEYGRKLGKASRVAPEVPSLLPVIVEPSRCKFITAQSDPLLVAYHDQEWGVPLHDDWRLFELLVLAGAQVELSWITILQRRDTYRDAFCGYNPACVAYFGEKHIQSLEADNTLLLPGGKIRGVVENAQRILQVVKEFGSLDNYLWGVLNNKPIMNSHRHPKQVPVKTSKSEFISRDLVKRGFRFVGPTIVYSFMQAAGMTNDHLVQCFRHQACAMQPVASQGEPEHFVLIGCDTSLVHKDANQSNPEQLLCNPNNLVHHQGGQQFDFSEIVHI